MPLTTGFTSRVVVQKYNEAHDPVTGQFIGSAGRYGPPVEFTALKTGETFRIEQPRSPLYVKTGWGAYRRVGTDKHFAFSASSRLKVRRVHDYS